MWKSRVHTLEYRVLWARVLTLAPRYTLLVLANLPRVRAGGFLPVFFALVILCFVYKFGVSPMFALTASALCFHFNAVGLWLLVTYYIVAAVLMYVDLLRGDSLGRPGP